MARAALVAVCSVAIGALSVAISACGSKAAPDLEVGAAVYAAQCASCHGARGEGGQGPSLAGIGNVFETAEGQEAFVKTGGGGMPVFGQLLTDEEVRNVVAYTRAVFP